MLKKKPKVDDRDTLRKFLQQVTENAITRDELSMSNLIDRDGISKLLIKAADEHKKYSYAFLWSEIYEDLDDDKHHSFLIEDERTIVAKDYFENTLNLKAQSKVAYLHVSWKKCECHSRVCEECNPKQKTFGNTVFPRLFLAFIIGSVLGGFVFSVRTALIITLVAFILISVMDNDDY